MPRAATVLLAMLLCVAASRAAAQMADLKTSVSRIAALDYATRMNAARLVRRAPAAEAVPVLLAAVLDSPDQFVRYRALVLLTAFNDRGTSGLMTTLLSDKNDRVREVAYRWIERHPDPALVPTLLAALQTEQAEFVRPALVRALAAHGRDPLVQRAMVAEAG